MTPNPQEFVPNYTHESNESSRPSKTEDVPPPDLISRSVSNLNVHPDKVYEESEIRSLDANTNREEVIKSHTAIVHEISEDVARICFGESVYVNIPVRVFDKKKHLLKYGQPVIYSIKVSSDGYRYQDIEANPDTVENPLRDRVMEALSQIPDVE